MTRAKMIKNVPVLTLRDVVVYPHMVIPLFVGRDKSILALDEAMESIAEFMHLSTQNVNFQKDDSTDKTIIKVFDSASNELIKQFPSEEVIEIAQKIAELRQDVGMKTGILLDEKV